MKLFNCMLICLALVLVFLFQPTTVLASNKLTQSQLNEVGTIQNLINSGKYEGVQLGQLYFQLGYLYHHSWLHKLTIGQQNLLLQADEALGEALRLFQQNGPHLTSIIVEILSMRGIVLKMLGKAEESLECYNLALSYPLHEVDRASLHQCRGDTYLMMDNYPLALSEYEASLALAPCKTERYHGYVNILKAQNQFSKGQWKSLLNRMIGIEAECHGTNKKSRKSKKKKMPLSVTFDTDFDDVFPDDEDTDLYSDEDLGSVLRKRQVPDHPYLFPDDQSGFLPSKLSDFFYAMYTVADTVGERDVAWQYLERANNEEHTQRGNAFDKEHAIIMKNTTIAVFSEAFVESFPSLNDYEELLDDYQIKYASPVVTSFRKKQKNVQQRQLAEPVEHESELDGTKRETKKSKLLKSKYVQPIFIIGMMRSGSTLLETILDTHPYIWGMGEDSVFNSNLTSLRDALATAPGVNGNSYSSLLKQSNHGDATKEVEANLASILAQYHVITTQEMQRLAIEMLEKQQKQQIQQHSNAMMMGISGFASKDSGIEVTHYTKDISKLRYIVDKMLFNYRNIGFIHLVFPNAPIIHMIRDPLDTLLSCYRLKFDDVGLNWTLKIPDLVLQYVLYLETMHHYRRILPNRILDIRYEDLVINPSTVIKKIFRTTMPTLKYDINQLLKFHENKRAVQTHSQTQVKQKLYHHSIGNWRRYAKELQPMIQEFRKYLPYLDELGALPFRDKVNWEMREDFPYEAETAGIITSAVEVSTTDLKNAAMK